MKLKKAIEILEHLKDAGIDAGHYDAEDAILLGIEALKRLEYNRGQIGIEYEPLLPGETED